MDNPERLGRAARNTGGFSIGTPLFAPEGRIDAQVALGGFVLVGIPDRSARPLRAELDAPLAAILPFSAWAEKPDSRENWRTYPPLS